MRLGAVVVPVHDLGRARAWYERAGFAVREVAGDPHLLLLDAAGPLPVYLRDHARLVPESTASAGAVLQFVVDDVAATALRMRERLGEPAPEGETHDAGRLGVHDPDGTRLEFVQQASAAQPLRLGPQPVASDMTVAFSADQPGTLARALEALTRAGLDTGGYAEIEGYFHLLVPDPAVARGAFEEAGFRVEGDQPVLLVNPADYPGSTAGLFRRVADAGVNVSFTYATADGRLVIGSPEIDRLRQALDLPPAESA